jgi:adenylyltransferase/sulfurtransferase
MAFQQQLHRISESGDGLANIAPGMLSPQSEERFSRQIRYTPFGAEGQGRLAASTAVIVGCGALGTVQASLLARAGVGTLRLIDRDYVEESNLQRQLLYTEDDARERLPKAEAARRHLLAANSGVGIEACIADLHSGNATELLRADVILDGTDNFETRFLINDYSVREGIPWIYGAAVGGYGIAMPVIPPVDEKDPGCFRCLYPEPPAGAQPTCETAGVLGPVTSLIGSIQAMEAIKILSGHISSVRHMIFTADLWTGPVRESRIPTRVADCGACGRREFIYLNARRVPVSLCGRNAVQIHERDRPLDLAALAAVLREVGEVRYNEFALRFNDGEHEITAFPDGRAIIKGTTDIGVARSIYSRFIGN